jgi:hypothetical protein
VQVNATRARDKGRLLSKFQRDRRWREGTLTIIEERDPELHRVLRVARLKQPDGTDVLPPLLDATIIAMTVDQWSITGFERLEEERVGGDAVCYQQSWLITPVWYRG